MLWPYGLHISLETYQVADQEAGSCIIHCTGCMICNTFEEHKCLHAEVKEQAYMDTKPILNELKQCFASRSSLRQAVSMCPLPFGKAP